MSLDRISVDPGVCHGKPCIKGTRIPAHLIVEMLAAGESIESVLESYPSLSPEDVQSALEYSRANEP